MLNKQGNKIGVLALQLEISTLNKIMLKQISLTHYLIGDDGLLRTPINGATIKSALVEHIDTEELKQKQISERSQSEYITNDSSADTFNYLSLTGQEVIRLYRTINLPGVHWILISEIERDEALAAAHRLGGITLVMFLLTGTLVAILAIYQAQRITHPIIQLAKASSAAAKGQIDQQVAVESNNEIGILTEAFNHMLMVRQVHEFALEQSNQKTNKALAGCTKVRTRPARHCQCNRRQDK
jgi:nitrogen fixation/metabolism regulation signal transduction histidine kinase